jgi:enoyl-CoA hydratase/3-hydroxyacyl-CoA dehydrogenase
MLRFPETSIGIFPGLGGTQRTTRICGIEGARFAILGGNLLDPGTARALGLLTHLVSASEVKGKVSEISSAGKPDEKYTGRPADPSHPVAVFSALFYSDSNMSDISSGSVPDGFDPEDPNVARQIKALSRAAPLALKTASHLLEQAIVTGDNLSAGLQLELEQLESTFDSNDAVEGLSALIEGRRPEYSGS